MSHYNEIKSELTSAIKKKLLEQKSFTVGGTYILTIDKVNSVYPEFDEKDILPELYQGKAVPIEIRGGAFIEVKKSNGYDENSIEFMTAEKGTLSYNQETKKYTINVPEIKVIGKGY